MARRSLALAPLALVAWALACSEPAPTPPNVVLAGQGGGLDPEMNKKATRDPIENEAGNGLKNVRGSIAMARTGAPHSATAQFFINLKGNDFLDYPGRDGWGYAVFGTVTGGMDVVDTIAGVATGSRAGRRDVPVEPSLHFGGRHRWSGSDERVVHVGTPVPIESPHLANLVDLVHVQVPDDDFLVGVGGRLADELAPWVHEVRRAVEVVVSVWLLADPVDRPDEVLVGHGRSRLLEIPQIHREASARC